MPKESQNVEEVTKQLRNQKKITEAGYPDLARKAKPEWDADQAVRTQQVMDASAQKPVRKTEGGKYGESDEHSDELLKD